MATEKEIKSLYGGGVEIVFYPNSHQYRLDGKRLTSVTAITGTIDKSTPLMLWAAKLSKEYLLDMYNERIVINEEIIDKAVYQFREKKDKAASIGSAVHDFAEATIAGETIPMPEDEGVINGITAFLKWKEENKINFTNSERLVFSKKHNYVGTLDAVGEIDGKKYLIDFKTSKGMYPEYYLQAAAYKKALEEETGEELEGVIVANFSKENGEFKIYKRTKEESNNDFETFISLLSVKNWIKNNKIKPCKEKH